MKPLLLLFLFGILVRHAYSDEGPRECRGTGLKFGESKNWTAYRTDMCGQIGTAIFCHLPGRNKTIGTRRDVTETVDDVENSYYCEPRGLGGLSIIHKATKKIVESPGICAQNISEPRPKMEWDEGDLVFRCNMQTFKTEFFGCRSWNGKFIHDEINGDMNILTNCFVFGDAVKVEHSLTIEPPKERERADENPAPRIDTPLDCTLPSNRGKEFWTAEFVIACLDLEEPDLIEYGEVVIRCITPDGSEIPVDDEMGLKNGSAYDCVRVGHGARLQLLSPEEVALPRKCYTGNQWKRVNETWIEQELQHACQIDGSGKANVVVVACTFRDFNVRPIKTYHIPIGETGYKPYGFKAYKCVPTEDGKAKLEEVTVTCEDGKRKLYEEWNVGLVVKKCIPDTTENSFTFSFKEAVVSDIACRVDGVAIPIGEKRDVREGSCKCYTHTPSHIRSKTAEVECRDTPFGLGAEASESTTTAFASTAAQAATVKRPVGVECAGVWVEQKRHNGVVSILNDKCRFEAAFCEVDGLKDIIKVGESARENGTQYTCEKRGEKEAGLVKKSFFQLCEEGDQTVDAWISEGVLRDCVRTAEKPIVHARICVLENRRIIEVGDNFETEFETYKCEVRGDFDAVLTVDTSKIHAEYYATNTTCKNGKKELDEWTENQFIRRACWKRANEKARIVDLGCLLQDGRIIPVGTQATFYVPATETEPELRRTLFCQEGREGFPPDFTVVDVPRRAERGVRACENQKKEGEEWEDKNVLRVCKEVDDKMVVVAIRCVIGNTSLEIGQVMPASEVSNIECIRVGDHDAAAVIGIAHDRVCENGKKLNEEWTDFEIRKACRVRDQRATAVVLGCLFEDGKLFVRVGEEFNKEMIRPGYEKFIHYSCNPGGARGAVPFVVSARTAERQDPKSPCGKNKYGEVWAKGRFLKKCKVIEGNVLSGVTIGCVTHKDTRILEGEVTVEDDYNIKCYRGEDGKMSMHFLITLLEQ